VALEQALVTPVGTFSVFGFTTPIPYPFGLERNGYLVIELDTAIQRAGPSFAALVGARPDDFDGGTLSRRNGTLLRHDFRPA
jgi:hypothetical protein